MVEPKTNLPEKTNYETTVPARHQRRIFEVRKLFSTIITGKYGKVVIVRDTYGNNE